MYNYISNWGKYDKDHTVIGAKNGLCFFSPDQRRKFMVTQLTGEDVTLSGSQTGVAMLIDPDDDYKCQPLTLALAGATKAGAKNNLLIGFPQKFTFTTSLGDDHDTEVEDPKSDTAEGIVGGKFYVQVWGIGDILVKASCAANVKLFTSSTTGYLDDDGTGNQIRIDGVSLDTARPASDGLAKARIDNPYVSNT